MNTNDKTQSDDDDVEEEPFIFVQEQVKESVALDFTCMHNNSHRTMQQQSVQLNSVTDLSLRLSLSSDSSMSTSPLPHFTSSPPLACLHYKQQQQQQEQQQQLQVLPSDIDSDQNFVFKKSPPPAALGVVPPAILPLPLLPTNRNSHTGAIDAMNMVTADAIENMTDTAALYSSFGPGIPCCAGDCNHNNNNNGSNNNNNSDNMTCGTSCSTEEENEAEVAETGKEEGYSREKCLEKHTAGRVELICIVGQKRESVELCTCDTDSTNEEEGEEGIPCFGASSTVWSQQQKKKKQQKRLEQQQQQQYANCSNHPHHDHDCHPLSVSVLLPTQTLLLITDAPPPLPSPPFFPHPPPSSMEAASYPMLQQESSLYLHPSAAAAAASPTSPVESPQKEHKEQHFAANVPIDILLENSSSNGSCPQQNNNTTVTTAITTTAVTACGDTAVVYRTAAGIISSSSTYVTDVVECGTTGTQLSVAQAMLSMSSSSSSNSNSSSSNDDGGTTKSIHSVYNNKNTPPPPPPLSLVLSSADDEAGEGKQQQQQDYSNDHPPRPPHEIDNDKMDPNYYPEQQHQELMMMRMVVVEKGVEGGTEAEPACDNAMHTAAREEAAIAIAVIAAFETMPPSPQYTYDQNQSLSAYDEFEPLQLKQQQKQQHGHEEQEEQEQQEQRQEMSDDWESIFQQAWHERKSELEGNAETRARRTSLKWIKERTPLQQCIDASLLDSGHIELHEQLTALRLQFEFEKQQWHHNAIRDTQGEIQALRQELYSLKLRQATVATTNNNTNKDSSWSSSSAIDCNGAPTLSFEYLLEDDGGSEAPNHDGNENNRSHRSSDTAFTSSTHFFHHAVTPTAAAGGGGETTTRVTNSSSSYAYLQAPAPAMAKSRVFRKFVAPPVRRHSPTSTTTSSRVEEVTATVPSCAAGEGAVGSKSDVQVPQQQANQDHQDNQVQQVHQQQEQEKEQDPELQQYEYSNEFQHGSSWDQQERDATGLLQQAAAEQVIHLDFTDV